MTRGISDMLNIPHLDDVVGDAIAKAEEEAEEIQLATMRDDTLSIMAEFEEKLKNFEGLDHAKSLDIIHTETLEHSRNLMDLGFNTDERSRRGIFEIATSMYKNAIDAKNSKRDMQLKLMKLILDKQKQEFDEKRWRNEHGLDREALTAEATILEDRNELIKRLRADDKDTPLKED